VMKFVNEINELKEGLRQIETETESFKRDLAETKRLAPMEEGKILPTGIILLLLAFLCGIGIYWAIQHRSGGLFLGFNAVIALILLYYGFIITQLGLKFRRMNRRSQIILTRAEHLKAELEREIAERQ
jgi:hypothetical protein